MNLQVCKCIYGKWSPSTFKLLNINCKVVTFVGAKNDKESGTQEYDDMITIIGFKCT